MLRDNFFEPEEKYYYNAVEAGSFWSNNYIGYKSNRKKTLSVEKYLDKVRPYLKDTKYNLKISDVWKNAINNSN